MFCACPAPRWQTAHDIHSTAPLDLLDVNGAALGVYSTRSRRGRRGRNLRHQSRSHRSKRRRRSGCLRSNRAPSSRIQSKCTGTRARSRRGDDRAPPDLSREEGWCPRRPGPTREAADARESGYVAPAIYSTATRHLAAAAPPPAGAKNRPKGHEIRCASSRVRPEAGRGSSMSELLHAHTDMDVTRACSQFAGVWLAPRTGGRSSGRSLCGCTSPCRSSAARDHDERRVNVQLRRGRTGRPARCVTAFEQASPFPPPGRGSMCRSARQPRRRSKSA